MAVTSRSGGPASGRGGSPLRTRPGVYGFALAARAQKGRPSRLVARLLMTTRNASANAPAFATFCRGDGHLAGSANAANATELPVNQ